MAANANASTTASVTIFPYGDGCGAGTACGSIGANFNVPDCRGVTLVGRDNMGGTARGALTSTYFGTNPDALGAAGGAQSTALSNTNQLPQFTPSGSIALAAGGQSPLGVPSGTSPTAIVAGGPAPSAYLSNNFGSISASFTGDTVGSASPSPLRTTQPSVTANCMIRVLAMIRSLPAVNDNDQLAAIEPRRRAA